MDNYLPHWAIQLNLTTLGMLRTQIDFIGSNRSKNESKENPWNLMEQHQELPQIITCKCKPKRCKISEMARELPL